MGEEKLYKRILPRKERQMNIYLIIFLMIAGITLLPLIVLCALRAIAWCKLIESKYPCEVKDD